jgi:pimeloyl-ACP methyl ester carboxylesterase
VVGDLHAALAAAGESGPYVPVGFSIGGLIARLFASTYPNEVGGLVLVEGQPPSISMRVLAILGEDVRAEVTGHDPDVAAPIDELVSEAQVLGAPPSRVPTVAIVAGKLDLRDLEDPTDFAMALKALDYNAALHEAQAAQVRDLGARIVYAEESGHLVPFDQPEIIGPTIEDVIAAVRDPSSWATPAAAS